ncbi:MAG TPA: hypothetical protein VFW33_20385, partial [Gemmataceae bacterium]|nr:hypothetical protein [Gemmataceae bacterium]
MPLFTWRKLFSRPRTAPPARRRPPAPLVELLETRLAPAVLATQTYVDDNWADVTHPTGPLTLGDMVRNDNDTIAPGTITATYGSTGFGHVIISSTPTSLAGAATINNAIANTNSGGTVSVLEGTYNEDVTVGTSLILQGAQHGVSAQTGRPVAAESTVIGDGSASTITVSANNVTIDGFDVQGPAGPGTSADGVLANGTTGLSITNNVIESNSGGIALGAGGGSVTNNLVRNNNASGSDQGNGITFFTASAGPWAIGANTFNNTDLAHGNVDIVIDPGTGTVSSVTITGNTFTSTAANPVFAL